MKNTFTNKYADLNGFTFLRQLFEKLLLPYFSLSPSPLSLSRRQHSVMFVHIHLSAFVMHAGMNIALWNTQTYFHTQSANRQFDGQTVRSRCTIALSYLFINKNSVLVADIGIVWY